MTSVIRSIRRRVAPAGTNERGIPMPRDAIHLNGVVQEEDRQIIKIGEGDGEKSYVLRMMTRDVRRKINAVQRKLEELDAKRATTDLDLDTYYDQGSTCTWRASMFSLRLTRPGSRSIAPRRVSSCARSTRRTS
jgi:hypothetical protein